MSSSPTARMIADAIENSGKTQREIATEMGYDRPNVISMLKNGEMRMPIDRIPAFAKATGIDALLLTKTAMLEYMPETWNVLSSVATPPAPETQINIRGPVAVIERFKSLCQSERRTYSEMLELMMIACAGAPGAERSR